MAYAVIFDSTELLPTMFEHVRMPNDLKTHTVQRVTDNLIEQMRQSAIIVVLDMLTHPQRFEMFAQLAARVKEQGE